MVVIRYAACVYGLRGTFTGSIGEARKLFGAKVRVIGPDYLQWGNVRFAELQIERELSKMAESC